MKPEAQRIAIAQACGWKRTMNKAGQTVILTPSGGECWDYDSRGNSYGPYGTWKAAEEFIPDYLDDLNVMHKVEMQTFGDWSDYSSRWHGYEINLKDVCGLKNHWMSATARQRAEAFLRTLNLWQD